MGYPDRFPVAAGRASSPQALSVVHRNPFGPLSAVLEGRGVAWASKWETSGNTYMAPPLSTVRGKVVWFDEHAADAMNAEWPPISVEEVIDTLQQPDRRVRQRPPREKWIRWIRRRSVIVYADEYEEEIYVRSVSASRRRL